MPHANAIAAGAGMNMLGTIGKTLFPAFFVVITRLYPAELVGLYVLATTALEVAVSLTVNGFSDGVIMFGSRHAEGKDAEPRLYQVLANGFVLSLGIALALVLLAHVGGDVLLARYYTQPGAVQAIKTIAWSLPLTVLPMMLIAATKTLLVMKWDALLMGFVRPLFLVALAAGARLLGAGLGGLLWAWTLAHLGIAILALWAFTRHFSLPKLVRAIRHLSWSREMVSFSIPQSLNVTFNTLITNMNVMMLAAFRYPAAEIGFFAVGSQIVRNIRQIKLAFSGSYTPVIARYHAARNISALTQSYGMVTRWITIFALPVALIVCVLRDDLIRIFHGSFHGDTTFMLWLVVPPLLSCTFGLAGNIVVATGHSGWNLLNSFVIAGANALFNYLWIPRYGILGAAGASVAATILFSIAQFVEARFLSGARLEVRSIYKPYVAMLAPLAIAIGASLLGVDDSRLGRIALSVAAALAYVVGIALLKLDPEDRPVVLPFLRRRDPTPEGGVLTTRPAGDAVPATVGPLVRITSPRPGATEEADRERARTKKPQE